MQDLEMNALERFGTELSFFFRYVDDIAALHNWSVGF